MPKFSMAFASLGNSITYKGNFSLCLSYLLKIKFPTHFKESGYLILLS